MTVDLLDLGKAKRLKKYLLRVNEICKFESEGPKAVLRYGFGADIEDRRQWSLFVP